MRKPSVGENIIQLSSSHQELSLFKGKEKRSKEKFKQCLNMIERNHQSSWEMLRVRTGALAEGTAAFSLFVCFIFKHPEPLLDQHFPVYEGSRGVQDSGERGKQGWKLMIFPAMKVKMPAWNQTLLEHYTGMGQKGREGKKIYYFSRDEILMRKENRSIHAWMSTADLKVDLSHFPSTFLKVFFF